MHIFIYKEKNQKYSYKKNTLLLQYKHHSFLIKKLPLKLKQKTKKNLQTSSSSDTQVQYFLQGTVRSLYSLDLKWKLSLNTVTQKYFISLLHILRLAEAFSFDSQSQVQNSTTSLWGKIFCLERKFLIFCILRFFDLSRFRARYYSLWTSFRVLSKEFYLIFLYISQG